MNYIKLLLLLTCFLTSLFITDVECLNGEGLVGGDLAEEDQFTYQVSVRTAIRHICTGGIIGDRFVLTAAHCIINTDNEFKGTPLTVAVGTTNASDTSDSGIKIQVEKMYVPRIFKHQKTKIGLRNRTVGDIAVLKLKHGLGLRNNPHLSKLELPKNSFISHVDEKPVISGYGYYSMDVNVNFNTKIILDRKGKTDHQLRFAETKVITNSECNNYYGFTPVKNTHICARVKQLDGKHPAGVCTGDSGGPLVLNGSTVIGVLSTGPFECRERFGTGIYTRVSSYVDFITNVMNNNVTPDMRDVAFGLAV